MGAKSLMAPHTLCLVPCGATLVAVFQFPKIRRYSSNNSFLSLSWFKSIFQNYLQPNEFYTTVSSLWVPRKCSVTRQRPEENKQHSQPSSGFFISLTSNSTNLLQTIRNSNVNVTLGDQLQNKAERRKKSLQPGTKCHKWLPELVYFKTKPSKSRLNQLS